VTARERWTRGPARLVRLTLGLIAAAAVTGATLAVPAATDAAPGETSRDVVVRASSLPKSALSEWAFWNDPLSPGGKLVGTPNTGGNLDPPPEKDPHVTFKAQVQGGVPYRCWVHMKVGTPKGLSKANKLWVQFSNAADANGKAFLKPGTGSYLTAQGPTQSGWAWVACDVAGAKGTRVTFAKSGEVTVYVQAGMEGVGFDQLLLSPARFLAQPPADAVVEN